MMSIDDAVALAAARIQRGLSPDQTCAELVQMGAPEETAKEAVRRAFEARDDQGRRLASSMLSQGRSAAEVWEALVASGIERGAAEKIVGELVNVHQQPAPIPSPALNVYAPPLQISSSNEWVHKRSGTFGQGFAFGFFCGCIALIYSLVSRDINPDMKRGITTGFVTSAAIGILVRVIGAVASP